MSSTPGVGLLSSPTSAATPSTPLQVSPTLLWLSLHFAGEPSEGDPPAPPSLAAVMSAHRSDCEGVIASMIAKMSDKLLPCGEHERTQAIRLYYAILDNMITAETQRLTRIHQAQQQQQQQQQSQPTSSPPSSTTPPGPFRFESWLFSRIFHASVLAVAYECVFFAHRQTKDVFESLDVSAWELLKLLELSVRALPSNLTSGGSHPPPPALKQHLKRLENECLCWKIWVKESPLLKLLDEAEKKAKESESSAESSPQAEAKDPSTPVMSPTGSQTLTVGYLSGSNSKAFDLFSKQLFTLAADHLSYLCSPSALNISNLFMEACWELLLEILTCHTHLLYNRHLDTIILCVLYNILVKLAPSSNVSSGNAGLVGQSAMTPLDFKRIIQCYSQRWEQNQGRVVRDISCFRLISTIVDGSASSGAPSSSDVSADDQTKVNIISFYNKYFINEIKVYSLEVIKPKLVQALESQAMLRAAGNPTHNLAPPTPGSKGVGLPPRSPAQLQTPTPALQHAASLPPRPQDAPPNPSALPSPSPSPMSIARGRFLPHRSHPYAIHANSHLSVPAGSVTPGYNTASHNGASIHSFLSPRKLHIPSTNIYLSRMANPPIAVSGVAARVAQGVTSLTSSNQSAPSTRGSTLPNRLSHTPTKSKLATSFASGSPAKSSPRTGAGVEDAAAAVASLSGNVTESPVRNSNNSAALGALTPQQMSLYAFGESPRRALDDINRMLSAAAAREATGAYASPQPSTTRNPQGSGGSRRQLFTTAAV